MNEIAQRRDREIASCGLKGRAVVNSVASHYFMVAEMMISWFLLFTLIPRESDVGAFIYFILLVQNTSLFISEAQH